jgi:hypothetical protein
MKTLVIFPKSDVHSDSPFYLIDPETGEGLASHFCSGAWFAKGDLHDTRKDRLEKWKEKYGEKTEAKFIDETDYNWEEILEKNKNFK